MDNNNISNDKYTIYSGEIIFMGKGKGIWFTGLGFFLLRWAVGFLKSFNDIGIESEINVMNAVLVLFFWILTTFFRHKILEVLFGC